MSSAQLDKFAQIKPADIEWRDGLPFSREFDDIYFSPQDGLAESEYVFLDGNHLPEDWESTNQERFCIGELGFGSGLNFLITATKWQNFRENSPQSENKRLHYISIEKRPLTVSDFQKASQHWPQFHSVSQQLIERYPSLTYGRHQIEFEQLNLTLTLMFMPVDQALTDLNKESLAQQNKTQFDHWYLDGFAPAKNASMWANDVIHQIACLSKTGTKLATFSVAASIKNPLKENGFEITKRKGFGRKREMLTARLVLLPENKMRRGYVNLKYDKPWFDLSRAHPSNKVAIIGGGIAGCSLAYVLTQKGLEVDLFEQSSHLASAASGAAAGIFHPQLTSDFNLGSQIHWQAYLTLLSFLKTLDKKEQDSIIISRGIQRVLKSIDLKNQLLKLVDTCNLDKWIQDSGFTENCLYFPDACALDIAKFCKLFISKIPDEKIRVLLNTEVKSLTQSESNRWVLDINPPQDHENEFEYQHVVYCGGYSESTITSQFLPEATHWKRGQTCRFVSESLASKLDHIICEQLYLVPHGHSKFLVGSTFDDFKDNNLREDSQQDLTNRLESLLKSLNITSGGLAMNQPLKGQVGYRLHTADRMPIASAVADNDKLIRDLSALGQKRIAWKDVDSFNKKGLWTNSGYGSHGLLMSLLAAKHLASLITNDISPLSNELAERINTARFIAKKLK